MNFKINSQNRTKAIAWLSGMVTLIFVLLVLGIFIFKKMSHPAGEGTQATAPHFVSLVTPQFTSADQGEALQAQQATLSSQSDAITGISKQFSDLQAANAATAAKSDQTAQSVQSLQNELSSLSAQLSNMKQQGSGPASGNQVAPPALAIQTFSLSYNAPPPINDARSIANYVPAGTFAKAVLLAGADTNAAVTGQSNTVPIVFRILDNGWIPTEINGDQRRQLHTKLKGCEVIGSAFGDISSERAEVRLVTLSCVRENGDVLELPVQGTVFEGLAGIKGTPISRNGPMLMNAGLSGFVSGIGQAFQQQATNQETSPLGTTTTIDSDKALQYGVLGGASQAANSLANYYIQRAEQYHPVIEINPGAIVDVFFTQGFSLKVEDASKQAEANSASETNNTDADSNNTLAPSVNVEQAKAIMAQIQSKTAGFGSTVGVEGNDNEESQ